MTTQVATIVAACIAAVGAILAAIISKTNIIPRFRRTRLKISGKWHGWSIYIPVDNYNPGTECVYKIQAEFNQRGSHVSMNETLQEFFDLEMNRLEQKPRHFVGKGSIVGESDVALDFHEIGGLSYGTIFLVINPTADELEGVIALRNFYVGRPVSVKLSLRRIDDKVPPVEELGIDRLRILASQPT